MEEIKAWYQSRAVWGALVAILAGVLQMAGLSLDAAGQAQLTDSVLALVGIVGGLLALYGRLKATAALGGADPERKKPTE
ncbi:hypothetical protein [Rhizobium alvei]|uniref:Holin n=1 Tax=Rhizobium alvei TaxID=1132659 RepID=A0ABT8YSQ7_9HYPH|nr:hypothetical protein [Rhizobium alvei]MDO6966808.1 hypothetical protein [Rhizobium alvei]